MANNPNRRASARSSRNFGHRDDSSERSVDVFGDEFAVDGTGVADGYRPTNMNREPSSRPVTPPRSSKPPHNDENKSNVATRWAGQSNSTQEPVSRNSFTLANDSAEAPTRIPSTIQSDLSRRISTVSSVSTAIPRTQSPFVGASAPSHPYGMYPQDTNLNRASTISSIRSPERPYNGPSRPAHPYAMYPQDTTDENQTSPLADSEDIANVGFPGLGQRYARRLGPDGEDADDIIGPDGHTEQLPPYTRYAQGPPTKDTPISPIAEAFAPSSPNTPRANLSESNSSETIVPSPDSTERGGTTVVGEEVQGSKEKWVDKSKRRTCFGRLPVWAVVLIIAATVIVAAVVGGLIGSLLGPGGRGHPPPKSHSVDTEPPTQEAASTVYVALTTSMVDAEPLTATPGNLAPLPTGSYGLPIEVNDSRTTNCLSDQASQGAAWGCMPEGLLVFNVSISDDDTAQITLDSAPAVKARGLCYGAQPPVMKQPAGMDLMQDVNQPEFGPAYYFCEDYDKLVILPEDMFPSPMSTSKVKARSEDQYKRDTLSTGQLQPGDKPWFCWWNSTYLEGFIYLQQQSDSTDSDVFNIISEMNSMETPAPAPSAAASSAAAASSSGASSAAMSSSYPAATSMSSYSRMNRRDHGSNDNNEDDDDDDDDDYVEETEEDYVAAYHGVPAYLKESTEASDDDNNSYTINMSKPPPLYPMIVKIEERRVAGSQYEPYCEQMQVLDNGIPNQLTDKDGHRIRVVLNEIQPVHRRAVYSAAFGGNRYLRRDDQNYAGCLCEWTNNL